MDERTICQCTRCKKKHSYSERNQKPSADKSVMDSVCPSCSCKSFYDLTQLTITVRDNAQTFTARCLGKTASCTANPKVAALNCAKKVLPGYEFTLTEKPTNLGHYRYEFLAEAKVVESER